MVPIAVLTFAGLVHQGLRRAPARTAVTATGCVLALVFAGLTAVHTGNDKLIAQRAAVRSVFRIAGDRASVISIAAPAPLVLAHRTNPVEYQMFKNGFDAYVDDTYPGGLRGLAQHLGELAPTFFAVDSQARYRWVMPTIERDYLRVGRTADVDWWVRRDLGADEIARLRGALRRHRVSGSS